MVLRFQFDHDRSIHVVNTRTRPAFCRPCLDWGERHPHLAGRVGASMADLAFRRDRIRRRRQGRPVEITEPGIAAFRGLFGARI
jgi:hypothetical protein